MTSLGQIANAAWAREQDRADARADISADDNADERQAVRLRVADVEAEAVDWLWQPRIPYRKLTGVVGDPEAGKTYLLLAISAAVSSGAPLPGDSFQRLPARVLLLTAEDGIADTIRPRLEGMDADLERIEVMTAIRETDGRYTWPDVAKNLNMIDAVLDEGGFGLVGIDPLNAYLGNGVDAWRDNAVRAVLGPLSKLAERRAVAMVFVMHLTKGARERALYRIQGNIAFGAAARSVLLAGQHTPTGQRALVQIKNNLAERAEPVGYEIADGRFAWTGTTGLTAEDLLTADKPADHTAHDEATAFLRLVLADGPRPASEVYADAQEAGIAKRTLDRAKRDIGVYVARQGQRGKRGGGTWVWSLPIIVEWDGDVYQ